MPNEPCACQGAPVGSHFNDLGRRVSILPALNDGNRGVLASVAADHLWRCGRFFKGFVWPIAPGPIHRGDAVRRERALFPGLGVGLESIPAPLHQREFLAGGLARLAVFFPRGSRRSLTLEP